MIAISIRRCLLQELLDKRGMTQVELHLLTGLSTTQISEYIAGKRGMALANAKTIAHVLHCNMDDLYEWIITE